MGDTIEEWQDTVPEDWYPIQPRLSEEIVNPSHYRNIHKELTKCTICSFRQIHPHPLKPVFHKHFSSRQLRIIMGVEHYGGFYRCISCSENRFPGRIHKHERHGRRRLVVSSSTLHNYYLSEHYEGDSVHIDYCTIPGAKIQDLYLAYREEYLRSENPLDVILVAGLNNLNKGEEENQVMERIREFAIMVTEESMNYHRYGRSSFSVATLPYAPKLAWLDGDGPCPYPPNHNKCSTMKALNGRITLFNNMLRRTNRQPRSRTETANWLSQAPQFHNLGVKTSVQQKGNIITLTTSHDWGCWRKAGNRQNMMHLGKEYQ